MRVFYVYVIELTSRDPQAFYVGSSAFPPRERFYKHKVGSRPAQSRHVTRRGRRLRPDLYAHLNPFPTREAAKRAEKRVARDLERRGYVVHGACGRRQGCRI